MQNMINQFITGLSSTDFETFLKVGECIAIFLALLQRWLHFGEAVTVTVKDT